MCPNAQRFASWGAFCLSLLAFGGLVHLEWGRCGCRTSEAPVGITWEKESLPDDGGPPRLGDRFTLTNVGEAELSGVTLTVSGREDGVEVRIPVGDLQPGEAKVVPGTTQRWTGPPLDVSPRDVLLIACDGCSARKVPVRQLGKATTLREAREKETTDGR